MAEREGFEPPDGCPSAVFKTAAIDHSATSPVTARRGWGVAKERLDGAEKRNRTADLLITNQSLYRLSYFGIR